MALTAAALLYSIAVSISGQTWVFESSDSSGVVRQFNPATLVPVLGTGAALYYTVKKDVRSVWLIAVALAILSALFLFSLVLYFAPAALAVIAAGILLTVARLRAGSNDGVPTTSPPQPHDH